MSSRKREMRLLALALVILVALALVSLTAELAEAQIATPTPTPVGGEFWCLWDGRCAFVERQWKPSHTPTSTPSATLTPLPTATPTRTPEPSATPFPTPTPEQFTPTPTPDYTPVAQPCFLRTDSIGNTNVRAAPRPGSVVVTQMPPSTLFGVLGYTRDAGGNMWLRRLLSGYVARWIVVYVSGCEKPVSDGP